VWGERFRLKVIERPGRGHVEQDGDRLLLYVPPKTDAAERRDLLVRWQRAQLRNQLPDLVHAWEPKVGRKVSKWSIRRMKTKWGSCNRETGHTWFNLELVTKHPDCLEYIVVHEMAHLVERHHGEQFTKLMDKLLPDWRARRDQLNGAPLAHEEWRP
jgi:predicted metal-dependent hydrolase